ncbi:hypothetical protein MBLNU230_g7319t1 [Neophaeotheca triangularis]
MKQAADLTSRPSDPIVVCILSQYHHAENGFPNTVKPESGAAPIEEKHYKDWPNAAAFNALGDVRTPCELEVIGHFPSYVAGSLYRTGPGGYKVSRQNPDDGTLACSHWFDGFTTMHKFDLVPSSGDDDSGCQTIKYSSYCQVDELIEKARKTGRLDGITFGQKRDPCDTFYQKLKTVFTPTLPGRPHTANVGVAFRDILPAETRRAEGDTNRTEGSPRRLMTVTSDHHITKQFDADTLEPLGVTKQAHLHPALKGPLSAAHAARDPETGDIFNYNLDFGARPTYRVFKASPTSGEIEILAEIAGRDIHGAYIHSFFITQNFVVLCLWPAYFSAQGASILWERNLLSALAPFNPKSRTTWLVIDRRQGRGLVKKFTSPAFFSFHTVNAWETPRTDNTVDITCELAEFKNMDILHRFYYQNLVSNESNVANFHKTHPRYASDLSLTRYQLESVPLSGQRGEPGFANLSMRIPSTSAGDLPVTNPNFALKPHRYVWAVLDRGYASFSDGLGKTDTETGECSIWEHHGHTPGEPIFIPAPGALQEDEGVVLSVVLDGSLGSSYLLCLDARTMSEVSRALVGRAVGLGFHGVHVPSGT